MSDSMRVDQILSQIRSIRQEATGRMPGVAEKIGENQAGSSVSNTSFSEMLTDSVKAVSETQKSAASLAESFERGDKNISLAEVMVASQKANVSFTAMVEVRNKMIDAYQEVMRMSV
ncbi:flagellar hook-basal body complex protein FliE [Litorivivens sp.]|uniref:flagellar hook-basal body complex protein FliE n=1 Tax=Litorivivens sp. TaxID=2020868 RepID=UPI003566F5DA